MVEKDEVVDGSVVLQGRRAQHIIKFLKPEIGAELKVGVINDKRGVGRVVGIDKRKRQVTLDIILQNKPASKPMIDFVVALPRPIMLKRILSQLTALGVGNLHFVNANRVEKSFWHASIIKEGEWYNHLLTGLEQCVDTRMPALHFHSHFRPFVEDYLPSLVEHYSCRFVADPSGKRAVSQVLEDTRGRVLICVGPEGGWVDFELDLFSKAGLEVCHIGERILKVDTAVVALHGYASAMLQQ